MARAAAPRWWRFLLAALVATVAVPAPAQPQPLPVKRAADAGGPGWGSLTNEQRTVLAPLQSDWASIDAPRKTKWLDLAARYPKMPPADQQRMQARMSEWARMTPQDRAQARLNFQQAKQLPNQDRQDQWQAYQALPESERKALADRAAAVVQAAPGATTTLVTRQPAPPAHQQAGMPKIAATPGFVDRNTLLPQRGTQSAGVRSSASAPTSKP